jgi:hypothetical protein
MHPLAVRAAADVQEYDVQEDNLVTAHQRVPGVSASDFRQGKDLRLVGRQEEVESKE